MTVKQLKEKLATMDESLEVLFYTEIEEAGDRVRSARVATSFPYCQGDAPPDVPNNFVLLT